MADPLANQVNGRKGVRPIGHYIPGANDAVGWNPKPRCLVQDSPRGFEVAVSATEKHQGPVGTKERNSYRHDAFVRSTLGHLITMRL